MTQALYAHMNDKTIKNKKIFLNENKKNLMKYASFMFI
jgi:hypothetical protein